MCHESQTVYFCTGVKMNSLQGVEMEDVTSHLQTDPAARSVLSECGDSGSSALLES